MAWASSSWISQPLGHCFLQSARMVPFFLSDVAVPGAEVGEDLVEVGFDLFHLMVGHDAGPVAALGLAVIAFHVTGVGTGEYHGIDEDGTDLDELLLC